MDMRVMLVVGIAALVGLIPGWLLARFVKPAAALVWTAILVGMMFVLIFLGRQSSGWDGIGYSIGAFLMAAPAAVGSLLGAALAQWPRRRG